MKDIEARYRNIIAIAALAVGITAMMLPSAKLVSTVFAQSNSGHSLFGGAFDRFQEASKQAQNEFSEAHIHTDWHDTNAATSNEYEAIQGYLTAK